MPNPILIDLEDIVWRVILADRLLSPKIRVAIESGRVDKYREGRLVREVTVTIEELQDLGRILTQMLVDGTDSTPTGVACARALQQVRSILRAVER